jgi:DNA-binding transcriptional LysR family regulator
VQLIFRGHRYGGLTPEGQRALVWARSLVSDARTFREEMRAARHGLSGHIRMAVIPTALTWAATLSARFADLHPNVRFSVLSRTSAEILAMLENLDIDAGLSYLDNEPLGRVVTVPIYRERYVLVCRADSDLAAKTRVAWRDLEGRRLCLLTPDMQNRRIINQNFMAAGVSAEAQVESNSTLVLASHVREGDWLTILPSDMAEMLAGAPDLCAPDVGADRTAYRWPDRPTPRAAHAGAGGVVVGGEKACENGEIRRLRGAGCRLCFIQEFYQTTELRY